MMLNNKNILIILTIIIMLNTDAGISEDVTVQESPPSSPSSSSSSPGDGPQIMKCISEGNPEPAVEWFRNGVRFVLLSALHE